MPQSRRPYTWLQVLMIVMTVVAVTIGALALHYIETRLVRIAGESLSVAAAEIADKLDRLLFERYGDVRMMAKAELKRFPVLGWSMWMAGFVFIERKSPASARRSLEEGAAAVRNGKSIVVFPEGTRSPDGQLLEFKKGGFLLAIRAGVPVVPIAIRGSREILPKHTLLPRAGTIEVRFGAPIPTAELGLDRKVELADRTREVIRGLKEPLAA